MDNAPNPKPTTADKARFGGLASLYTAFSLEFADFAVKTCQDLGLTRIADPFAGMGTLGEAGRRFPVELLLSDFSPFASLSCAFRSAPRSQVEKSARLIEHVSSSILEDGEGAFFARLLLELTLGVADSPNTVLARPSESSHQTVALCFFMAALGRIRLYKSFAGSNPTWVRRPDFRADGEAARQAVQETLVLVRRYARQLPDLNPRNGTECRWSSIEDLMIRKGGLDAIVTSPPYANRTDYIRHYLPGSELLLQTAGVDEREIRQSQIGTPLIRVSVDQRPLPPSVKKTLEVIRTHASYASERYYYKGFLYYFNDMFDAISRMQGWLKRGGMLLMVIQDSYYKDLRIPTSTLVADIATSVGFRLSARKDWKVATALSHLSPHTTRVANKKLNETALVFNK